MLGYKFLSKDEISPHLEDRNSGRSILWAKDRGKYLISQLNIANNLLSEAL
jgi:formamidopyrimidine-DNA glycosylase